VIAHLPSGKCCRGADGVRVYRLHIVQPGNDLRLTDGEQFFVKRFAPAA
jgi:hypothetical protein